MIGFEDIIKMCLSLDKDELQKLHGIIEAELLQRDFDNEN